MPYLELYEQLYKKGKKIDYIPIRVGRGCSEPKSAGNIEPESLSEHSCDRCDGHGWYLWVGLVCLGWCVGEEGRFRTMNKTPKAHKQAYVITTQQSLCPARAIASPSSSARWYTSFYCDTSHNILSSIIVLSPFFYYLRIALWFHSEQPAWPTPFSHLWKTLQAQEDGDLLSALVTRAKSRI